MIVVVAILILFVPAFVLAVVVVIVVIFPAAAVTVAIAVPVMVVLEVAARTIPIAGVVAAAFVARNDPTGTFIRRTRPVAAMPDVVAADGIPIAFDPGVLIFRAGANRTDRVDARWRRRSDLNTNGNLAECRRRASKNRAREQQRSYTRSEVEFHDCAFPPRPEALRELPPSRIELGTTAEELGRFAVCFCRFHRTRV